MIYKPLLLADKLVAAMVLAFLLMYSAWILTGLENQFLFLFKSVYNGFDEKITLKALQSVTGIYPLGPFCVTMIQQSMIGRQYECFWLTSGLPLQMAVMNQVQFTSFYLSKGILVLMVIHLFFMVKNENPSYTIIA